MRLPLPLRCTSRCELNRFKVSSSYYPPSDEREKLEKVQFLSPEVFQFVMRNRLWIVCQLRNRFRSHCFLTDSWLSSQLVFSIASSRRKFHWYTNRPWMVSKEIKFCLASIIHDTNNCFRLSESLLSLRKSVPLPLLIWKVVLLFSMTRCDEERTKQITISHGADVIQNQ